MALKPWITNAAMSWCDIHSHLYTTTIGCQACRKSNEIINGVNEIEASVSYKKTCTRCKKEKHKYHFPFKGVWATVCKKCATKAKEGNERLFQFQLKRRLEKLIDLAMRNKMSDLRNHLFETLEMVKDGDMETSKAKTICEIAQVIINTAKVEVDAMKVIRGVKKNDFLELEEGEIGSKMPLLNGQGHSMTS